MKFFIIGLSAIIVLGGTFVGLGYSGIVNIPGISPEKKVKQSVEDAEETAEDQDSEKEDKTEKPSEDSETPAVAEKAAPETPPPAPPEATPPPRRDGTERLAQLWSTMDSEDVVKILDNWQDGDVLLVLVKMEDKKLAAILSALPADRAARFSKGIKALEKGGK
ncbi:MAG: hypothetical protein IH851_02690 [Armatimonadetes bacterium]|nr:hypothetical protein [Armatimonadota bacterium]